MKKVFAAVLFSGILIVPFSCAQKEKVSEPDQTEKKVVEIGSQATKKLLQTLKSELIEAMKTGPLNAIDVCSKKALTLTDQVAKEIGKGIEIKRTSLRYRNPANAPDKYEREVLEFFQKLEKEKKPFPKYYIQKVSENGKTYYRFYKPLTVKPICLTCHGKVQDMDPKLQTKLMKLYPGDQAVNYEEGDFRGVVRVSIPEESVK